MAETSERELLSRTATVVGLALLVLLGTPWTVGQVLRSSPPSNAGTLIRDDPLLIRADQSTSFKDIRGVMELVRRRGRRSGPEVARDELVFAPEEGVRLKKTFELVCELKLVDDETKIIDDYGEHVSRDSDLSISEEQTIIFSDEYHSMEDGRATRISRTFETLSRQSQSEARWLPTGSVLVQEEREATSELEGLAVIFTWAEDEEKYAAQFVEEDEEEDKDLLEDLDADADLTWFLPESEVDEGDSWDLEVDAFLALTSPGGDTKIEPAGEVSLSPRLERERDELFKENLKGYITCTYEGAEDGIATVAIEIDLESRFEHELVPGMSQFFSSSFELEGELRWNVEAGHASTLLLEGDRELECDLHFDGNRVHDSAEGPVCIKVTIE